jgi:phosphoribosylformylglycinamidine (FGAM) synthase-like enzyme
MKKYLGLLTVLALAFFIGTTVVLAEDNTGSNDKNDDSNSTLVKDDSEKNDDDSASTPGGTLRKEMETRREEAKNKIETLREEAREKMKALREGLKNEKDKAKAKIKEIRIASREKVLTRFDEAVKHLTALKERVGTQITNLGAKGVDTVAAKAFVVVAETNLETINTKITTASDLMAKSTNALTAEEKTTLKTLATDIQNLIKATRQSLGDAVKSLKENVKIKRDAERSTTEPETNNQ